MKPWTRLSTSQTENQHWARRSLRAFSIQSRLIFPLLVAGLALFAVGAWWSVESSVEADIQSRLETEANRIERTLQNRLDAYGDILLNLRGHMNIDGKPTNDEFAKFVAALDVPRRYPDVNGMGLIAIQASKDSNRISGATIKTLKLTSTTSLDTTSLLRPHPSLFADQDQRDSLFKSIGSAGPVLSPPFTLSDSTADLHPEPYFFVYLPVFMTTRTGGFGYTTADVSSVLFTLFNQKRFFEDVFGPPSLSKERVNFTIDLLSPVPRPIYNRFGLSENAWERWLVSDHKQTLFGREMRVTVRPLPSFYSFSDRYLPSAVAIGSAFISILVLLILKASQNQLIYETHAKEVSVLAMRRSREQTEQLKKINEFAKAISTELELDALISRFFSLAVQLAESDGAFLYFTSPSGDALVLREAHGRPNAHQPIKPIAIDQAKSALMARPLLRKSQGAFQTHLQGLVPEPAAETNADGDWLLVALPSRDLGICGLLLLERDQGPRFEGMEVELLESIVAQAAGAIENALLFRKVEEAARAKNAFLANMSHEIRTPLNAIIGFSEIVATDAHNAQTEEMSRNIRRSGQQLTRIIDDILDFSNVEAGKIVIEKHQMSLPSFLNDLGESIAIRAEEKRLAFSIENQLPIPRMIFCDAVRLKQVLMNLVGNAIKFTESGAVTVLVHAETAPNSPLRFRIRDSGIGIAASAQAHLFEPFSQVDESKTRRYGGSGLGLALSRRLCQELGGDLRLVESAPGLGSTFEATVMPGDLSAVSWIQTWNEDFKNVVEERSATIGTLADAHLLLVEDSPDNTEIFRFFLESAGATVEVAENGLQAVSSAVKGDFDLILMDIQIPEIDGKEATRRIRNCGYNRPIVALTAHALSEERASCLQAGCNGQITKPVAGSTLVKEVANYLTSHVASHSRRVDGPVSNHL